MKTTEFFGLPFSGKTTVVKNIEFLTNSKNTCNYRLLTIFHLYNLGRISLFEYFYWSKIERKRELSHKKKFYYQKKKKNSYIKKMMRIFLPSRKKLLIEIDKLFYDYKKNYMNLINFLKKLAVIHNAHYEMRIILDWLKFDIIGLELKSKYPKKKIFCSEGFYQLLLSILIRININKNEINELIKLFPKLDNLFILINRSSKTKDIKSKNERFSLNSNFIKNYFYIIRCIKKKTGAKIFSFKQNEINQISKEIYEILDI